MFICHLNECNECVDYNSQWLMLLFVNIDNKYSVSLSKTKSLISAPKRPLIWRLFFEVSLGLRPLGYKINKYLLKDNLQFNWPKLFHAFFVKFTLHNFASFNIPLLWFQRTGSTYIYQCFEKCVTGINIIYAKTQRFFVTSSDGSTDMDDAKLYPVVVRYFDEKLGRIVCSLLTMVECKEASTGENIFHMLNEQLVTKRDLSWSNCVSFASDNAAVMSGMGKGVAGHISRVQPNIYFMGCACHLMNIAAQKAAGELPCPVSDVLIDIYYFLDKSANRKQRLKEFQGLCGKDARKILKLVNTRWLSLGLCLNRLLEMWEPLERYFGSEQEKLTSKGRC